MVILRRMASSLCCESEVCITVLPSEEDAEKEYKNGRNLYKVHTSTNALCIKLNKLLKFTLKIILAWSYMFRSTTIMREPTLEP